VSGATEDAERLLRIELMTVQIKKHNFDMEMELRKLNRQTIGIVVSVVGLTIAAFAAGAAWLHYFVPR